MGASIIPKQKNTFAAEAVIVVLASFVAIELFSLASLATGISWVLPFARVVSSGILLGLSLLSIVALLAKKTAGNYLALLTSACIVVLSGISITTLVGKSGFDVSSAASSSVSLVLGLFLVVHIFKSNPVDGKEIPVANDSKELTSRGEYAIEMVNVTKKYFLGQNVVSAVNSLNLKVKKGEFVAIMGPSGSGKSTLLNLIGALDKPSSGQILIDGVNISGLNDNQLARLRNEKLGFVFQAYNLIARSSVMRNMELPALVKGYSKEKRQEKMTELLNTVNLYDKTLRKPKTLSGGEQQRVAIARALINDPEIVLADEPTGNVDSKTGQSIMGFLRKLNSERKTTVIVVTHDPEVAKRTDRIIYFRDGGILKEEQTMVGTT